MKKNNLLILGLTLLLCACGAPTTNVKPDIEVDDNTITVVDDTNPDNSPDKIIICDHKYDSEYSFSYKIKDAVVHRITRDSSIFVYKNINNGNEEITRTDREMVNYNCYPGN